MAAETRWQAESSLEVLFRPQSVGVVGVSANGRGLGLAALKTLLRHRGDFYLFAVNPNATSIEGVDAYPSLRDVPGGCDLVLAFTRAAHVLGVLEDAAASGARGLIVYSSGFSDGSGRGKDLEAALVARARELEVRLLGPNCQGIASLPTGLVASFSNAFRLESLPEMSRIAYVGQSGALGGSLFDLGRERGCAPDIWVSTGNQADVEVVDVVAYLLSTAEVDLYLLYFEEIPEGRAWEEACRRAAGLGKQLVVLRAGRTAAGKAAVESHTGALVGDDRAFELVGEGTGVIFVADVNDAVDTAVAYRNGAFKVGRRLGVVTTSGGAGGLAADLASSAGLSVARYSPRTESELEPLISELGSVANPLDVTADIISADPGRLGRICQVVAADPNVDQVLVILSVIVGATVDTVAQVLSSVVAELDVSLSVVYLASSEKAEAVRRRLSVAGIATFGSLTSAVSAIGRLAAGPSPAPTLNGSSLAEGHPRATRTTLTEAVGATYLDRVGVSRPRSVLATSAAEAEDGVAQHLREPVVMKVQGDAFTHKSEYGLVRLDVARADVGRVYRELMARAESAFPLARADGILIQEQVRPGVELLMGVQRQDNGYRPVLTVGRGGISTEVDPDVASALFPVAEDRARQLLESLRCWPILNGFRSQPPADVEAACRAIARSGELLETLGAGFSEFEINPLIVHFESGGVSAVDFVAYTTSTDPLPADEDVR